MYPSHLLRNIKKQKEIKTYSFEINFDFGHHTSKFFSEILCKRIVRSITSIDTKVFRLHLCDKMSFSEVWGTAFQFYNVPLEADSKPISDRFFYNKIDGAESVFQK